MSCLLQCNIFTDIGVERGGSVASLLSLGEYYIILLGDIWILVVK